MRLVKAKFGYLREFTPAEREEVDKAIVFSADRHWEEDPEKKTFSWPHWYTHVAVDLDRLPVWLMSNHFEVIAHSDWAAAEFKIPESREVTVINQRVNVAVPGFGLMAIKQVRVAYDLCTDALQEELRQGWQILAICPQPDQRRPDYVLGKPGAKEE